MILYLSVLFQKYSIAVLSSVSVLFPSFLTKILGLLWLDQSLMQPLFDVHKNACIVRGACLIHKAQMKNNLE